MISIYKTLQIPFDKQFYNLPLSHYEMLSESIGASKVSACVRELLVYHKNNKKLNVKARLLLNKLSETFLLESTSSDEECECGFLFRGEEYEECPVCGKELTEGKECFYLNEDGSCSQDGEECTFLSREECGK